MLTLKMTSSQHTNEGIERPKRLHKPAMQQERSVIGQTDLETDRADVELDLG
jgi:hypothetical protein